MRAFLFCLSFFFLVSNFTYSQKKFTNPEKANALSEKFADASVVAAYYTSKYRFLLEDDQLSITQADQIDLITLRSNVKYRRSIFYNDNIEVNNGFAKYTSGRGVLRDDKSCGNYEVDDIFYSDAKVCTHYFDILYEASEVTFASEKKYKDPKYLTKVFFHDQEPAEYREITFDIPAFAEVELLEINFEGYSIKKEVTDNMEGKTYKYSVRNIDELKSESNSMGMLHEYPHILVITKSYQTENGQQQVLTSVADLYGWYRSLVTRVNIDSQPMKEEVFGLIANCATDEEKIRNIYYWVQENIKYIAFENGLAGFIPEAPQKVYNNKYGDCKGMAILTKTMLNIAGFDARLAWIGTNSIPYNYDIPSLAVDNHMICTLKHRDRLYILDATEKYIALGAHSERIQGKEMLIEDGDNYIRKIVPVENAEKNLVCRTEKLKLAGEVLIGEGNLLVNGEAKKMILYISKNSRVDDKEKLYDFLSVSEYSNTDLVKVNNDPETDRDKPLNVEYEYKLSNKVNSFDNEIFIDLDWDKTYKDLVFDEDRNSDYYFGRKVRTKVVKTLEVPAGYSVSHLPEPIGEKYKDISITVGFQKKGTTIIYTNEITVDSGKILKEDFEAWNKLRKKLNTLYEDQIILTKKS